MAPAFLALCKKSPAKTGGAKELTSLPPDFDVNAGTTLSFSQLDTWFTMPVAFLNGDVTITPLTTDCHIRFSHTVFRAGRSNASFVANLRSTGRHGKYRRTCQGRRQRQRIARSHHRTPFSSSRLIGNAKLRMPFPSSTDLRRGSCRLPALKSAVNARAMVLHCERHQSLRSAEDDFFNCAKKLPKG
jgi:hypothetical protein